MLTRSTITTQAKPPRTQWSTWLRARLGPALDRCMAPSTHAAALPAPPGQRDPLGPLGERLAAGHLRRTGHRIIGTNLRVPMGEADILALGPDGRTIVLVEVKARRVEPGRDGPFNAPEANITAEKRAKLAQILRHLTRANGWHHRPRRIDVIAIEWPIANAGARSASPVLRHHHAAVSLDASARSLPSDTPATTRA